jgi:acyl carrier protein
MQITRAEIYSRIPKLLADIVEDWELENWDEEVSEQTRLIADLDLTSVSFVDLFVAIEKDLNRTVGFHDLLMVDGKYIQDLSLGELTDFLDRKVNSIAVPRQNTPEPEQAAISETKSRIDASTTDRFKNIIPRPGERPATGRKNRRAVFLLSAPRSGSTLLQIMLAGNPKLFAPPELHLLWFSDLKQRRMVYSHESNKHLVSGAIRAIMELDHLTVEQATTFMEKCEAEGMTTTEFYAVLQQRLGNRLLVDKTPSYAYSKDILRRAELDFDEALYIHLVRHPCGMTRSFTDAKLERTVPFMFRNEAEFSSQDFAELAWLICNQNIVELVHSIPSQRHYRVHYEDLVTKPQATIEGICHFLGVRIHPDMLDPYKDKGRHMADGVGTVSQMSGDLKFHLHSRIEPEAAQRWKRYISEDAISATTWQFAEMLGYKKETDAGPIQGHVAD